MKITAYLYGNSDMLPHCPDSDEDVVVESVSMSSEIILYSQKKDVPLLRKRMAVLCYNSKNKWTIGLN